MQLVRVMSTCISLTMFRSSIDFAFFADRHGDPLKERFGDIIEWEGRPDTVVFHKPYVLAFDARFVEVRDTSQSGKLVQLIKGTQIRCTYDGQSVSSVSQGEDRQYRKSANPDEALPHLVMRESNIDRLYELAPYQ